jgi:hypothetical protein
MGAGNAGQWGESVSYRLTEFDKRQGGCGVVVFLFTAVVSPFFFFTFFFFLISICNWERQYAKNHLSC